MLDLEEVSSSDESSFVDVEFVGFPCSIIPDAESAACFVLTAGKVLLQIAKTVHGFIKMCFLNVNF